MKMKMLNKVNQVNKVNEVNKVNKVNEVNKVKIWCAELFNYCDSLINDWISSYCFVIFQKASFFEYICCSLLCLAFLKMILIKKGCSLRQTVFDK